MNRHNFFSFLSAIIASSMLVACGSDTPSSASGDQRQDCPPVANSSMSAIERMGGIENFEKYSNWQKELPPKECAGSLAAYIPDLPAGYALPPTTKPWLMQEGHVYMRYAEMPELEDAQDVAILNVAAQAQFEFEIVQLTNEQAESFRKWFADNPNSYSEYPIDGRMFYATGGGVWYVQGHRLTGGIAALLGNDILIKFTMPNIYSDRNVATEVATMFHTIASQNGQ
ncbi:MAG: hypothetical protein AAF197_09130 [Pseudomonadota bacterium]